MSESSARRVSIRLSAEGAEQVRQQLVATGEAGDRAMKQIASASITTGEATNALSGRIGALSEAIRGVAPAASGVLDVLASVAAGAESLASRAGSLEGAMGGLAGRFASFAGVVVGVPALLQSVGLGINAAGTAATSAAATATTYQNALTALNAVLLTTEQRATAAAAALHGVQVAGAVSQGEQGLGALFERRTAAQNNAEALRGRITTAEGRASALDADVLSAPNRNARSLAERSASAARAEATSLRNQLNAAIEEYDRLGTEINNLGVARQRALQSVNDPRLDGVNGRSPEERYVRPGGQYGAFGEDARTFAIREARQNRGGGGGRTAAQAEIDDVTRLVRQQNEEYDRLQFELRNVGTETGIVTGMTQGLATSVSRAGDNYERFFSGATSALEDMIVKGKSAREVLSALASDIARVILRQTVTNPLASAASSLISAAGSAIGNYFAGSNLNINAGASAPARAMGGPVDPGGAYLVGEERPEIFVPRGAGTILPNTGGGIRQTINIDARGAEAGTDAKIRAAVAVAVRQSNAELLAAISRGGQVAKQVGRR